MINFKFNGPAWPPGHLIWMFDFTHSLSEVSEVAKLLTDYRPNDPPAGEPAGAGGRRRPRPLTQAPSLLGPLTGSPVTVTATLNPTASGTVTVAAHPGRLLRLRLSSRAGLSPSPRRRPARRPPAPPVPATVTERPPGPPRPGRHPATPKWHCDWALGPSHGPRRQCHRR